MKKWIIRGSFLLILLLLFVIWSNSKIENDTQYKVFDVVDKVPEMQTGLLLGTSRLLQNGQMNPYFAYRIDAAETLYKAGKIKYIIASGDHSRKNYNEPLDMKEALIKRGIPENVIFLDYAGLRTLDSVIRSNAVFSQDSLLVISQKFHNQRAVFIAASNGIAAYGFNATDVDKASGIKTQIREYFARAKVFIDIWLNTGPKYYGDKITIP